MVHLQTYLYILRFLGHTYQKHYVYKAFTGSIFYSFENIILLSIFLIFGGLFVIDLLLYLLFRRPYNQSSFLEQSFNIVPSFQLF